MIQFDIPPKARALLKDLAAYEGKSESEIAFEALMERIEDWHDAQIIAERMKDDQQEYISLDEVERNLASLEHSKRPAAE